MKLKEILEDLNEYEQLSLFDLPPDDIDVGDRLEISIKYLVVNKSSLEGAFDNIYLGRYSRTSGHLDIWYTEDREFLLVDGFHRLVEYMIKGEMQIPIEIVGVGYTDYWYIPDKRERFKFDLYKDYLGLEVFAEDSILDDIYKDLERVGGM